MSIKSYLVNTFRLFYWLLKLSEIYMLMSNTAESSDLHIQRGKCLNAYLNTKKSDRNEKRRSKYRLKGGEYE